MRLVFEDRRKRVINGREEIVFSSYSSFHLIKLTARAKSEKQLGPAATDDEDLTFMLDGRSFPKLRTRADLVDAPAAFSGGSLYNLAKTVFLLLFLKGRDHTLVLKTDEPSATATFEGLEVYTPTLTETLRLGAPQRAEDGDRRPWLTFALVDLPLKSFSVGLVLKKRFLDSDDVKVIIDGEVMLNHRNLWRKLWYFIAASLSGEQQNHTFLTNRPAGLHHLELYADRTPELREVVIDFGREPAVPLGIPTVSSPKWTTDFYDDTEEMLLARIIFGESRNQPREVKVAVGWSVRNRIGKGQLIDPRKIYDTYHDVILDEDQYASLKDPNVRPRLEDPLNAQSSSERDAWYESYRVAREVISGKVTDPTDDALFFHDDSMTTQEFLVRVPRAVYVKTFGRILFYGVRP